MWVVSWEEIRRISLAPKRYALKIITQGSIRHSMILKPKQRLHSTLYSFNRAAALASSDDFKS